MFECSCLRLIWIRYAVLHVNTIFFFLQTNRNGIGKNETEQIGSNVDNSSSSSGGGNNSMRCNCRSAVSWQNEYITESNIVCHCAMFQRLCMASFCSEPYLSFIFRHSIICINCPFISLSFTSTRAFVLLFISFIFLSLISLCHNLFLLEGQYPFLFRVCLFYFLCREIYEMALSYSECSFYCTVICMDLYTLCAVSWFYMEVRNGSQCTMNFILLVLNWF